MKTSDSAFTQWVFPLLFIGCAGWIIWHGASYIMAFGGFTDALAARYRQINFLDYAALIGLPVFLILGVLTVKRAQMEMEDYTPLDQIAMFIGRVTMLLIALVVGVMMYEVILRYVFERPTLWANECLYGWQDLFSYWLVFMLCNNEAIFAFFCFTTCYPVICKEHAILFRHF